MPARPDLSTLSSVECGVANVAPFAVPALLGGDSKPSIANAHELRIVQFYVIPSLTPGCWSKTKRMKSVSPDGGPLVDSIGFGRLMLRSRELVSCPNICLTLGILSALDL